MMFLNEQSSDDIYLIISLSISSDTVSKSFPHASANVFVSFFFIFKILAEYKLREFHGLDEYLEYKPDGSKASIDWMFSDIEDNAIYDPSIPIHFISAIFKPPSVLQGTQRNQ